MEFGEFEEAYFTLLTRVWSREEYMMKLMSDPRPILREVGLEVPESTEVTVIRSAEGEANLELQHQLWVEGLAVGSVQLFVIDITPIEFGELGIAELEAVPGGATYCCSCCPCCTCTA